MNDDWSEFSTDIKLVKNRKFFVFRPVADKELVDFAARCGRLPSDYLSFVKSFGAVGLFRDPRNNWHRMTIVAPPVEFVTVGDDTFVRVGYYVESGYVGWKLSELRDNEACPMRRVDTHPKVIVASGFREWFDKTYQRAKRDFGQRHWRNACQPAEPFSAEEQGVVEAIGEFEVRKVGVASDGKVIFQVKNGSRTRLDWLSVGIRDRKLTGQVAIPVGGIDPGESGVVEWFCYQGVADPNRLEVSKLPLPEPEDRPYYSEFGIRQ